MFKSIFDKKLHLLLFAITLFTTTAAGAIQAGHNPLKSLTFFGKGLPFSLTLMGILLAHEFGHYFMSRYHEVSVTLPYFIPAPSLIGTFGAFIKIKSPMPNKRVLFDIGIAGPLAGIVVCLPVLIFGLLHSRVQIMPPPEGGIILGNSLMLELLTRITWPNLPENTQIILHPMAFAGWIGLFVTALNLMPIGQLDGGHVAYALLGESAHAAFSRFLIVCLFVLGLFGWEGWFIWALLLFFVLRLRHPTPINPFISLDRKRKAVGILGLIIFIFTFMPMPFSQL